MSTRALLPAAFWVAIAVRASSACKCCSFDECKALQLRKMMDLFEGRRGLTSRIICCVSLYHIVYSSMFSKWHQHNSRCHSFDRMDKHDPTNENDLDLTARLRQLGSSMLVGRWRKHSLYKNYFIVGIVVLGQLTSKLRNWSKILQNNEMEKRINRS